MEKKLNANHLKLIAILAMTVDHVTDLLYPGFPNAPVAVALHTVGRLTAPIMWFFVAEGFHHTSNLRKYLLRMFVFAVISHFAYCFAFGIPMVPFTSGVLNQTSVIWPLFLAIVALWVLNSANGLSEWKKLLLVMLINLLAFPADWSCIAVMAVVYMYDKRGNLNGQMLGMLCWVVLYAVVSFFYASRVYAVVQLGVILVYPLLRQYNGQRGRAKWMKWFFYLYYPAHLMFIGILRLIIYGDVSLLF